MKNSDKPGDEEQRCVEPTVGEKVYDYYNGALSAAEVGRFEIHLVSCPYCERVILDLDNSLGMLNDEQDFDLVSAGELSPDLKAVKEKVTQETKRQKRE